MKTKFCLWLFYAVAFLLQGCDQKPIPGPSYLQEMTDSLPVDKEKNIVIYSINPNDCINCLYGFTQIYNELSAVSNSKIYLIAIEREIEKKELIRTTQNISLKDSTNKVVLWDKKLFKRISQSTNNVVPVSILCIYDYKKDSIIFSKPIKSISSIKEFSSYLSN